MSGHQVEGAEVGPSTLLHGTSSREELLDTQAEYPDLYFSAVNAVQHNTQRRLVWALIQHDGRVSYNQLERVMNVSQRTVRKHASNLESDDLINRIDANFTFIEYGSVEAEALMKHALTCWYNKA